MRPGDRASPRSSPSISSDAIAESDRRDSAGERRMADKLKLGIVSVVSTALFVGLAVLGWGSFPAFFAHPARVALVVITFALVGAATFTSGNLSPGEREDRANRWVLAAFLLIGLAAGYLPAWSDRTEFWTIDGDAVRWLRAAGLPLGGRPPPRPGGVVRPRGDGPG